mgnify:CR=1 FL=1
MYHIWIDYIFIGFIFQEYNVLDEFTVGANIALALELQGKKATDEQINKILAQVDAVPDEHLLGVLRGERKHPRKRTRLPRAF